MVSHTSVNPLEISEIKGGITQDTTSVGSSKSETTDIEQLQDDHFSQHIEKDGVEILVTWTREEEKKVVRKADFLFLPLFTVCGMFQLGPRHG